MNSKVGLSKIKALVNSTTQQREQQCYQLPSIRNRGLWKYMTPRWRLFSRPTLPFRLWLADLAFLYSLVTIELAHKMLWHSLNGYIALFCLSWHFVLHHCFTSSYTSPPYSLSSLFCFLYHYADAMQSCSCLLTPFIGVNIKAIGLHTIIFDGLYRSSILSSLLFILVTTNGYVTSLWQAQVRNLWTENTLYL